MYTPGIIIYEKQTRWEAELKRQFPDAEPRVRPCRRAADIPALMASMPDSVLILDLDSGPAECLRLIGKVAETVPQPPVVVLAAASLADLEWPARELGAVEFTANSISGAALARLCARLLPKTVSHRETRRTGIPQDTSFEFESDLAPNAGN